MNLSNFSDLREKIKYRISHLICGTLAHNCAQSVSLTDFHFAFQSGITFHLYLDVVVPAHINKIIDTAECVTLKSLKKLI